MILKTARVKSLKKQFMISHRNEIKEHQYDSVDLEARQNCKQMIEDK